MVVCSLQVYLEAAVALLKCSLIAHRSLPYRSPSRQLVEENQATSAFDVFCAFDSVFQHRAAQTEGCR